MGEKRKRRPVGFCVDIGAPKSVVGYKEIKRIFARQGLRLGKLENSSSRFRFADTTFQSHGQVTIPLATSPGVPPIQVPLDVVSADIPALLGLDILDK